MKTLLRKDETCALCGKPACEVHMITGNYMGLKLPVVAALCPGCFGRKDRDEFLKAYIERIFYPDKLQ